MKKPTHTAQNTLEQDKEFLESMLCIETLKANKNVNHLATESNDFITTKNNFWD